LRGYEWEEKVKQPITVMLKWFRKHCGTGRVLRIKDE
jgi:hypothetical protein